MYLFEMLAHQTQFLIPKKAIPLFLRIRADHPSAHHFAYYLEYLTFHLPEGRLVPALEWLIRNRLTGERFLVFIREECNESALELFRQLTRRLEETREVRRLHRKDFQ